MIVTRAAKKKDPTWASDFCLENIVGYSINYPKDAHKLPFGGDSSRVAMTRMYAVTRSPHFRRLVMQAPSIKYVVESGNFDHYVRPGNKVYGDREAARDACDRTVAIKVLTLTTFIDKFICCGLVYNLLTTYDKE